MTAAQALAALMEDTNDQELRMCLEIANIRKGLHALEYDLDKNVPGTDAWKDDQDFKAFCKAIKSITTANRRLIRKIK